MSRGGGSSTNDQILAEQRAEAAERKREEDLRQDRLRYGRERINAAFRGGDWTKAGDFTPQAVAAKGPRHIAYTSRGSDGDSTHYRDNPDYVPAHTAQVWQPGTETGSSEGIGEDFYNNFYNTITSHYQPQLEEQYETAKSQNLFDLARRGLLRSSRAATAAGTTEKERANAELDIASRAQGQKDQLISDVNTAESRALNMIEGAEDPTTGINTALAEATAIQNRGADLTGGLGDIFSAGLNAFNNYNSVNNARRWNQPVTPRSPTASSGKSYA